VGRYDAIEGMNIAPGLDSGLEASYGVQEKLTGVFTLATGGALLCKCHTSHNSALLIERVVKIPLFFS
jgi:hypothetical protein